MTVEGEWSDRIVGLDGQRVDVAMMRTPDGHSKLELMSYQKPAMISPEPKNAPPNTLGIRRLMFAVDDIEDTIARLRTHGAELIGEVVRYPGRSAAASKIGRIGFSEFEDYTPAG
jgi:hypothetical protein